MDLAERVAVACRVLGRLDLTRGAHGHVSARLPGTDHILIRARGPAERGVRYTTGDEILVVDLDGRPVKKNNEDLSVPQEVFIHTEIYRARPDMYSVIHIHPPTLVLFTVCDVPLLPIFGAYDPSSARFALEGVPVFPRSILINSPERGRALVGAMGSADTCLMRGHGITTAGACVELAALAAIRLNELAVMNYQARLLGSPQPIPEEDRDEILAMGSRRSRPAEGGPLAGSEAAIWRYYCELTAAL